MRGFRRVVVMEEFWSILDQIHSTDCVHAGIKKTYVRVSCCCIFSSYLFIIAIIYIIYRYKACILTCQEVLWSSLCNCVPLVI